MDTRLNGQEHEETEKKEHEAEPAERNPLLEFVDDVPVDEPSIFRPTLLVVETFEKRMGLWLDERAYSNGANKAVKGKQRGQGPSKTKTSTAKAKTGDAERKAPEPPSRISAFVRFDPFCLFCIQFTHTALVLFSCSHVHVHLFIMIFFSKVWSRYWQHRGPFVFILESLSFIPTR